MVRHKGIRRNDASFLRRVLTIGMLLLLIATVAAVGAAPMYAAEQDEPTDAAPTVLVASNDELGEFLTDSDGMTLYLFTNDRDGVSNCYGQCAVNWPPLLLEAGQPVAPSGLPGTLSLLTRTDGAKQVTYDGIPLYYWIRDERVGDTTGHEVGDVWFVVKP